MGKTFWGVCLLIYFISCGVCWRFHHNAYSKGGRWQYSEPGLQAVFMTFTPIVNTVGVFAIALDSIPEINTKSLFNIKK